MLVYRREQVKLGLYRGLFLHEKASSQSTQALKIQPQIFFENRTKRTCLIDWSHDISRRHHSSYDTLKCEFNPVFSLTWLAKKRKHFLSSLHLHFNTYSCKRCQFMYVRNEHFQSRVSPKPSPTISNLAWCSWTRTQVYYVWSHWESNQWLW